MYASLYVTSQDALRESIERELPNLGGCEPSHLIGRTAQITHNRIGRRRYRHVEDRPYGVPVERPPLRTVSLRIVCVDNLEQVPDHGLLTGLLVDLAHQGVARGLAEVRSAARQVPGAGAGIAGRDRGDQDPPRRVANHAVRAEPLHLRDVGVTLRRAGRGDRAGPNALFVGVPKKRRKPWD